MKFLKIIALFIVGTTVLNAQAFEPIQNENVNQVFLNLKKYKDDKIPVEFVSPILFVDSVEFHIPRIIPGTYDVHNYGKMVSDLKAIDAMGKELKVKRLGLNRWRIYQAKKLYKITYWVDDTFDDENSKDIFEPAGTCFDEDIFLLNNFGIIGYLNGYKDFQFELTVVKPEGFYGSTALQGEIGDSSDFYSIVNYFTLHDNPIMYNVPDTASHVVGGAKVLVSVYSPAKVVNAAKCIEDITKVLDAAADYLGGELPVEKYAVLIYTVPLSEAGTSYGALEHQTSTVLYMPEFEGAQFYDGVRDITSHEFFHIITPLGIHSEMIADFDFMDPEMSEHIWLYEGVTEYNSHLVQVRSGIYSIDDFLDVINEKMHSADDYDAGIPLTVASKYTLSFLKDQYQNFYQKGALAGMALDLELLRLSNGEYRLIDLLMDLGEDYGVDTFFVDAQLFEIIVDHTYPELAEFFARHFEGAETFHFAELLEMVGVLYIEEFDAERLTVGNVDFGYNFETGRLRIEDISEMDEFGKELGWEKGDEIVSFNGVKLDLSNISEVISDFYNNTEVGDKLVVVVARPKGDGEFKTHKLSAKTQLESYTERHLLTPIESPTSAQKEMREKWLNQ